MWDAIKCLFIFLEYLYYLQLIKVGLKNPSRNGCCLLTLLFVRALTGHTPHPAPLTAPPFTVELGDHAGRAAANSALGFCSRLKEVRLH